MSRVKVKDFKDVEDKFINAIRILHYMRRAQKRWHKEFGFPAKKERESWEAKADAFLSNLEISPDAKNVGVEIENENLKQTQ